MGNLRSVKERVGTYFYQTEPAQKPSYDLERREESCWEI